MHRLISWVGAMSLAAFLCGCQKPAASPVAATPTASSSSNSLPGLPTQAQPKLATTKLWLGAEEVSAELAATPQQVQAGMMFRTNMAENDAMLFNLFYPQRAAFWMPNCPLPLSVAYIDSDGVIEEIHDLKPYDTNNVFSAVDDVRFALETPQGWFERHNVRTGALVRAESGTLMQVFSRR